MPSTDRMLELTAKHRWLSRLTAGCVFQWVNVNFILTTPIYNIHIPVSTLLISGTKGKTTVSCRTLDRLVSSLFSPDPPTHQTGPGKVVVSRCFVDLELHRV
jgi:hypothetical protein